MESGWTKGGRVLGLFYLCLFLVVAFFLLRIVSLSLSRSYSTRFAHTMQTSLFRYFELKKNQNLRIPRDASFFKCHISPILVLSLSLCLTKVFEPRRSHCFQTYSSSHLLLVLQIHSPKLLLHAAAAAATENASESERENGSRKEVEVNVEVKSQGKASSLKKNDCSHQHLELIFRFDFLGSSSEK